MDFVEFVGDNKTDSDQKDINIVPPAAVFVENLSKSYGKRTAVLSNVSMQVDEGCIYSLVGPSGCGKTTLLNCIVGLSQWSSGSIYVLEKSVSGPQGRTLGYMPQETALYEDISINETIEYYGRLYGISRNNIDENRKWAINFLKLPSTFKLVRDCSGGMKRRVSLAVALFHHPKLLVLDEPTVGLDPLLRESILEYLHHISKTGRTILITTHYMEEAKSSSKVGIMRDGKILVEESPELLLASYRCTLLQDCLLKIFKEAKQNTNSFTSNYNLKIQTKMSTFSNNQEVYPSTFNESNSGCLSTAGKYINQSGFYNRVAAFSIVTWLQFFRHPLFLMAIFLLPISQIVLTFLVAGTTPKNLGFGVVKPKVPEFDSCYQSNMMAEQNQTNCSIQHSGCSLIRHLSSSATFELIPVESEETAKEKVRAGKLWGYMYIPKNYSGHFSDLIMSKQFASNETLNGSRVHVTMDMSHQLVTRFVIHDMYESFFAFVKETAVSCGFDQREFQLPLQLKAPVFGRNDMNFAEYFVPIVLLSVVTEIPMAITAILYVSDIQQGTLSRARVAGLSFFEVMISYLVTQGSIVVVQGTAFSLVVHIFWKLKIVGQYWLYGFLFLFSGVAGGLAGLFFGVATDNAIDSLLFTAWWSIFFMTYSGIYWPLRGLSFWARKLAYSMPAAGIIEPLRNVMHKGFSIGHETVWKGLLQYAGWGLFFGIVSIVVFTFKQKFR